MTQRTKCANPQCANTFPQNGLGSNRYCSITCLEKHQNILPSETKVAKTMAELYPAYHKDIRHLDSIDVYGVHHLFNVQDPSGCIQHASKKLLLSGVRTGGKSKFKDIKEARDTLTRWLELNPETPTGETK